MTSRDIFRKEEKDCHPSSHYNLKLKTLVPHARKILLSFSVYVTLTHLGVIGPRNTYVRCNDLSIQHVAAKTQTISLVALLVISILGPFLQMIIAESLLLWKSNKAEVLKAGFKRAYSYFLRFFSGGMFAFFIVEVLKTHVGEARPHFMNTCKPEISKADCEQIYVPLTWENCTNPFGLSKKKLMDTMKSFPSGHAVLGVYAATFMTIYLHRRVKLSWSHLLVPWLVLAWWTWAAICSASRYWDAVHHWWDILFGVGFGFITAYVTVANLCNWFENSSQIELAPNSVISDPSSENVHQDLLANGLKTEGAVRERYQLMDKDAKSAEGKFQYKLYNE